MKFILGQKKHMTQFFREDGKVEAVTVVEALPNVITQVKKSLPLTKEESWPLTERTTRGSNDGYYAVQVGSGVTKKSHKKPQKGHLKNLQLSRWLREFRFEVPSGPPSPLEKLKRGLTFGVEIFRPGDEVRVTGTSKGRGFQGVVKRHDFHGAPASHGTKDQLRMPGSIGATGPAKVFKGKRMPGRMGGDQVTATGLQIIKVDREKNLLYIRGGLPGAYNSLVIIQGPGTFRIKTREHENIKTTEKPSPVVIPSEAIPTGRESEVEESQEQADKQKVEKGEEKEENVETVRVGKSGEKEIKKEETNVKKDIENSSDAEKPNS